VVLFTIEKFVAVLKKDFGSLDFKEGLSRRQDWTCVGLRWIMLWVCE